MSTQNNNTTSKKDGKGGHYKYLNSQSTDCAADAINFPDSHCGCGPCKPTWLQRLATPKLFAINAGLILGVYIGLTSYLHGTLTTIERQFELSSSEVGAITIAADVAILCLVVFVTYFGHNGHRPRWIACGAIIISLGLFICSIPHFIVDPIDPGSILVGGTGRSSASRDVSESGVCRLLSNKPDASTIYSNILSNQTQNQSQVKLHPDEPFERQSNTSIDVCEGTESSGGFSLVKWLLIGQICIGCGAAPIFPLVLTHIDDSVRKHEVTTYTGRNSPFCARETHDEKQRVVASDLYSWVGRDDKDFLKSFLIFLFIFPKFSYSTLTRSRADDPHIQKYSMQSKTE